MLGRLVRLSRAVFSDGALVRIMLAYGFFTLGECGVWVAVLVYAYARGGAATAGLVSFVQLLPGILLVPLAAGLADRRSPSRLLAAGYLLQAAALAALAVAIGSGAPTMVVYALGVAVTTAIGTVRPAQAAVLPAIADDARALTSANVVGNVVDSIGVVIAGVVTAVFLGAGRMAWLLAVLALLLACAAVLVVPVRVRGIAGPADEQPGTRGAGVQALRRPAPAALFSLMVVMFLVQGALDVLFVLLAVGVIHTGQAGAGWLNGLYGVGSAASGFIAGWLLSRSLSRALWVGALLGGGALAAIGLASSAVPVSLLMVMVGLGRGVLATSTSVGLQRVIPAHTIARVFGVIEAASMGALAIGGLLVPALTELGGWRLAVTVVGAAVPVTALAWVRVIGRLDRMEVVPTVEMALLRSLPHFADLPVPALQSLASMVERIEVSAGDVIIREGDVGDRFYAVASGEVDVSVAGGVHRRYGRGTGLGEIALLRRCPRTATVTAVGPVLLYALEPVPFLIAVGGDARVRRRVDSVVADRLSDHR